jgi:hypothetical protein
MKSTLVFLATIMFGAYSAEATALTNANAAELWTGTGKDAFIKFQAPW